MTFSSFFFKEYKKVWTVVTAVTQSLSSLGPRCFHSKQPRRMMNLWDLRFHQATGPAQHKVMMRRRMMLMKTRLKMMMMMYVWNVNNSGANLLITTWFLLRCSMFFKELRMWTLILLILILVGKSELLITYKQTVFGFSKNPSMWNNLYNMRYIESKEVSCTLTINNVCSHTYIFLLKMLVSWTKVV